MLIDTHCHLDFPDFDPDRETVLENAKSAGVEAVINVGASLQGSRDAVGLAGKYRDVFASVGIHPHDARLSSPEALAEIEGLLRDRRVVAVGEVGLDYYRNLSLPEIQVKVFRAFIEMALKARLPLIVHTRQAEKETLEILKDYEGLSSIGVVIHCFSGSEDFLKKCLEAGFFVSFTCNVTYTKAQNIKNLVRLAPLDRMFLETDAPFLAPESKRGKRNEPANLIESANEVAWLKGLTLEKVCNETTKNARSFFELPAGA